MVTSKTNSRQRLLCLAFFICEASSIVSFVDLKALEHLYRHEAFGFGGTVPAAFLLAFVMITMKLQR
jgi:hypothetical protein